MLLRAAPTRTALRHLTGSTSSASAGATLFRNRSSGAAPSFLVARMASTGPPSPHPHFKVFRLRWLHRCLPADALAARRQLTLERSMLHRWQVDKRKLDLCCDRLDYLTAQVLDDSDALLCRSRDWQRDWSSTGAGRQGDKTSDRCCCHSFQDVEQDKRQAPTRYHDEALQAYD